MSQATTTTQQEHAEWKQRLEHELERDSKATIYSLATVETRKTATTRTGAETGLVNDDEAYRPVPRVRSLVHRSFVALRGAKQDAGSVVLQTTTDIRSAKASHLNVGEQGIRSTRNVEVVWWFPASQVQFRLLCTGYVLPHPSHPWRDAFPADLDTGDGGVGDGGVTDWEGVRIACFNALSPYLRASFARPLTPGSELTNPDEAKNWPNKLPAKGEEQDEKEREQVELALANFAVLFLEVEEVDLVDLGVVPNERYLYRQQLVQNGWSRTPLVP